MDSQLPIMSHKPIGAFSGDIFNINAAQAGISLALLLLYTLRNTISSKLPRWLQPFAQEEEVERKTTRRFKFSTLFLTASSFLGLALSVVSIQQAPKVQGCALDVVPWLAATLLTCLDRPRKAPKILLAIYLLMLLAGAGIYAVRFLDDNPIIKDAYRVARIILIVLNILIIGNMPLRNPLWDSADIGNNKVVPTASLRSPEDNITLFQFWTVSWVYSLARMARKKDIADEDIWQLPFEFQHTRLYMAFRELKGNLLPCLIEANGLDLFLSTSLAVIEKVSEVSNIRLTSKLYNSLDDNEPAEAVFWCLVMLSVDSIRQVSKTSSGWYSRKAYERSRGETFIGLFSKLLTRAMPGSDKTEAAPGDEPHNSGARVQTGKAPGLVSRLFRRNRQRKPSVPLQTQPASNAKVVNLVRSDTYEISQRFWDFPKLVSQPIKVIVTMYYLIDIMGWTSCIGFALMALFLAGNSILVGVSMKLERQRTVYSDRRAQAVSHFVEASRALKLNGWTECWSRRIMNFRESEMIKRLQISRVSAAISTVNVAGGAAYPLASICLYTLVLRDGLPNDVIWPSLALFGQLESGVKEAFDLISAFWKATIPIERVNKYMAEPDRDTNTFGTGATRDIEFNDATFGRPATTNLVLRHLTFKFSTGLTVVRGSIGSGKSSLLLAALNEMEHREGRFSRPDEPVAYGQQLPWLQSKTIRENIVFHQAFDPERYDETLYACCLNPDLALLPHGDQTKLEEGGIGLSGGQKARVALARAVYSNCRILLLDDPLAALDHDTASAIVQRFLLGPLARARTIVMVTHRDDLVLRHADQVIDVANGQARVLSPSEVQEELEHPYHADSSNTTSTPDEAPKTSVADEVANIKDSPEDALIRGGVSLDIFYKYMKAGGWHLWIALAIFECLSRYCDIARARLLEAWGQDSASIETLQTGYWGLPEPGEHPKPWLYVLAGLSAVQIITYAVSQLLLANISINAAQSLFKVAIDKVSKATFRYHDITPTGQLKNRLISDMGMVDGGILAPLEAFVFNLIALTLSVIAIMLHQPFLLIILVGVSLLFVYFFRIYVPISRALRRMEMRYLTPIIANIGVMQDGLVTIRALRVEKHFQDRHLEAVDDFQKQDHFFWSMAFWLDFRLGISSASMRSLLTVFMIWWGTPASAVGFVLQQTTIAMAAVQQLCEKFAALQLDAVSLERVDELNRIPEEKKGDHQPPANWPLPSDDITFNSMTFTYGEGLPPVLESVTLRIPGGSTCAVLGRTGSGKSTIANALLATSKAWTGNAMIGAMDLTKVNQTTLRSRITFIPQDPTLFPGTLRDNIDPEGKFADDECLGAIHRVLGAGWALDTPIDSGGKNLSQGQRQLVGIVRAVVRRSGLVILDEATASIDRATAAKVQRILREDLASSTVITIAHRLEAVEDADWLLRLDGGKVVECGPTKDLRKLVGAGINAK
ncbi:hypothetical protein G7046_g6991 [Stylonectria norvegica]|nr:hypothetical protein G7046_g6991 [Stylonectria norvegica]